jgi:hypothetical protein
MHSCNAIPSLPCSIQDFKNHIAIHGLLASTSCPSILAAPMLVMPPKYASKGSVATQVTSSYEGCSSNWDSSSVFEGYGATQHP